jgi:hypothetical protein
MLNWRLDALSGMPPVELEGVMRKEEVEKLNGNLGPHHYNGTQRQYAVASSKQSICLLFKSGVGFWQRIYKLLYGNCFTPSEPYCYDLM